jgi:hypothetical protein
MGAVAQHCFSSSNPLELHMCCQKKMAVKGDPAISRRSVLAHENSLSINSTAHHHQHQWSGANCKKGGANILRSSLHSLHL